MPTDLPPFPEPTPEAAARMAYLCGHLLAEMAAEEGLPDFAIEPHIEVELRRALPHWDSDPEQQERDLCAYRNGIRAALAPQNNN